MRNGACSMVVLVSEVTLAILDSVGKTSTCRRGGGGTRGREKVGREEIYSSGIIAGACRLLRSLGQLGAHSSLLSPRPVSTLPISVSPSSRPNRAICCRLYLLSRLAQFLRQRRTQRLIPLWLSVRHHRGGL